MDTNFTTNQILSMYNVGKDVMSRTRGEGDSLVIDRMHLEIHGLRVFLPRPRSYASALGFFQGSMDAIIHAMKVNLEIEEPELIKTFSFSVNEEFEVKPIGRGIRTGTTLELMPNLNGKTRSHVEQWAKARNIALTVENVGPGHPLYRPSLAPGTVVHQSIHRNELVITQTKLTIGVINRGATTPPPQDETPPPETE